MIALLLALAALTTSQGSALQLTFPVEPGVTKVEIEWQMKKVPFVRVGDKWLTVIGVDLDTKPGEHNATVLFTRQDGRIDKRETIVNVEGADFPTTELKVPDKYVQLNPPDLERSARETKEINAIYSAITNEILWDKPFRAPIAGGTGSNFGHRRVFNGEARAPHSGADLRAKTGTPIHSTNRGRVVLAKDLFFTGNTVIVDHGLGIYSLYAHLSRIDVKKGATVENGQVVGLAGATGRVTGPHLHWGVRIQGARVDPFTLTDLN